MWNEVSTAICGQTAECEVKLILAVCGETAECEVKVVLQFVERLLNVK